MGAPSTVMSIGVGLIILLLLFGYFYYRSYLRETFTTDGSGAYVRDMLKQQKKQTPLTEEEVQNLIETTNDTEKPYATTPIQSVDDYEYNLVFNQESDRALTKATRDMLMSQYPMDWSNQPPSSIHFQQGAAAMKEAFENQTPQQGNPYASIDGSKLTPPDTRGQELKEREALQMYVPTVPNTSTYDLVDAKQLIDKIYSGKGKVADVVKKGENVFEVVQVRDKNEKVTWEDEVPQVPPMARAATVPLAESGEATIQVPPAAIQRTTGLDPFFSSDGTRVRDGKWDYARWTPGLERMFAPTEPIKDWY
jgi:hypothetical protein